MLQHARWAASLAILALCGCGEQPRTAQAPEQGGGDGPAQYVIGFSQCAGDEPWREQMDRDIRAAAAAHPEIRLIYKDAQSDSTTQQAHVREYVTQDVDVIIISPLDVSLTSAVADAYRAGVPVIVLDRKVEGDQYTCFIGADNRVIGAAVGAWVIAHLGGQGRVVELRGLSSSTPAIERSEPFHEAIAGTGIEIVYDADMEWKGDIAREKMQAALAVNAAGGSIDLVYGANDPAAIQAWYAAKDAGREAEIIFVGVDALPHEGVKAVRDGILDATFQYPNGAAEAIDTALRILEGAEAPKTITLGTRLFTPENVDAGGEAIGP
ncbi:MAG: substrate-binding domain-containing protein [Phycisphaerales bacterium JB039]